MNLGRFNFSLPVAEGFHTTIKQPTQPVFFRDPKHNILTPKVQFEKLIVTNTHNNSNLADRFIVSRPKVLQPIKATFQPYVKSFQNIKKNYHFEPVIDIEPPINKLPELTETQLSLLTNTNLDPAQKFFLLSNFQQQLQVAQHVFTEMDNYDSFTNAEKNELKLALNRLKASYAQLRSQGRLSPQTQNTIVQDYFLSIKPIYNTWKTRNPRSQIEYEDALKTGLQEFLQTGDYFNLPPPPSRRASQSSIAAATQSIYSPRRASIASHSFLLNNSLTDDELKNYLINNVEKYQDELIDIYNKKFVFEENQTPVKQVVQVIVHDPDLRGYANDLVQQDLDDGVPLNQLTLSSINDTNATPTSPKSASDTDNSGDVKDNNTINNTNSRPATPSPTSATTPIPTSAATPTPTLNTNDSKDVKHVGDATDSNIDDKSEDTKEHTKDEEKVDADDLNTMRDYLQDNLKKSKLLELAQMVYASDNKEFGGEYGGALMDKNNIKNHVLNPSRLSEHTKLNKVLLPLYELSQSSNSSINKLIKEYITDHTPPINFAIEGLFEKQINRIDLTIYETLKRKAYPSEGKTDNNTNKETDLIDENKQKIKFNELLALPKTRTNKIVQSNPESKLAKLFLDVYSAYNDITGYNIGERMDIVMQQIGQGKTPTLKGQYKKVKHKKQQLQYLKKLIQSL